MGRYMSWVANSILFVLCCYLLANATNEVFAALLTPTPAEISESPAPRASQRHAWSERQVILTRNLFNASLLAPPAPIAEEEPEEDLVATKLPLKLLGTAAIQPHEFSWAAVEDETERRTVVVRVNDSLRSATVERIERRRIVLRESGELRELTLDEEETQSLANVGARARQTIASGKVAPIKRRGPAPRARRAPAAPPRAPEPEKVRKVDEDSFEVDRDDVDDLVRNPTALFSQARILPKYDEGEMIGLQINGIKSGSLFEEIGLQSGDVITKLNGITIDDPQESAKVLAEFSEAENFTVDVERSDGSVDTLEFSLGDTE